MQSITGAVAPFGAERVHLTDFRSEGAKMPW